MKISLQLRRCLFAVTLLLSAIAFSVPLLAWGWLRYKQIPELFASVRKQRDCIPSDLLLAQLRGCMRGPMAYFSSRKRLQEVKGEVN